MRFILRSILVGLVLLGALPAFAQPNTTTLPTTLQNTQCNSGVPILGAGTGTPPTGCGTLSGNTSDFGTVNGALTSGDCLKADANGNIQTTGAVCGSGSGAVSSVTAANTTLTISPTTGAVVAGINLANPNIWTSIQSINFNSASPQTSFSGAGIQVTGANGNFAAIEVDTFGTNIQPTYLGRAAAGTAAAPTAVQSGAVLSDYDARPYDGSVYTNPGTGGMHIIAQENFSTSAHGTYIDFRCTAPTTTTTQDCGQVYNTGFNGAIGAGTPSTGAFTTLSASSTVSGTGFTNYFASPPAIGGSAPAAGSFTTLSASGTLTTDVTGSTQCLEANTAGQVVGTGTACGSGGGGLGVACVQDFAATVDFTPGSTTALTTTSCAGEIGGSGNLSIYFDGVHQSADTWSLLTNTVTFDAPIPTNVQVVEWQVNGAGASAGLLVGTTAVGSGTSGYVLYDASGTLGNYPITGTAGSVVLSVSPTFTGTVGTAAITATGVVTESGSTASTSTTTGNVINSGGEGIAKALWVGGLENVAGVLTASGTTASTSITTGEIVDSGGLGISLALWVGGLENVAGVLTASGVVASTSSITGNIIDSGGEGIAGALWVGGLENVAGVLTASGNTASTTTTTGEIVDSGGLGVAGAIFAGSTMSVTGGITFAGLATSGTVGGSVCQTSAGILLYESGVNCFSASVALGEAGGRLTLASHTPVMTVSETGKTTLYYDAYKSNNVPVYNGSTDQIDIITSNEMSDAMAGSGTGVLNASGVFDIWFYDNSGSPVICVATNGSGGGWASDTGGSNTARGSGYSALDNYHRSYVTNANALSYCYNGSTNFTPAQYQATYLGTILTAATAGEVSWTLAGSASAGTAGLLGLWNYYNRVNFATTVELTAATYSYTTATIREADASTTANIAFVTGALEDSGSVSIMDNIASSSNDTCEKGVGLDSTTAFFLPYVASLNTDEQAVSETYYAPPQFGSHTFTLLEQGKTGCTFNEETNQYLSVLLRM